jgi:hypothetical protein
MGPAPLRGTGSSPGHPRSPHWRHGPPHQRASRIHGHHHRLALLHPAQLSFRFRDRRVVGEGFTGPEHRLQQRPQRRPVGRPTGVANDGLAEASRSCLALIWSIRARCSSHTSTIGRRMANAVADGRLLIPGAFTASMISRLLPPFPKRTDSSRRSKPKPHRFAEEFLLHPAPQGFHPPQPTSVQHTGHHPSRLLKKMR